MTDNEKIKYKRTKTDIHNNKRVLNISKSTPRVFVIYLRRDYKNGGEGSAEFVKNGKIYNPFFDVFGRRSYAEYGKTLEQLIEEGFNLRYAGYHGDCKEAFWNNSDELDLIIKARLLDGRNDLKK